MADNIIDISHLPLDFHFSTQQERFVYFKNKYPLTDREAQQASNWEICPACKRPTPGRATELLQIEAAFAERS